MNEFFKQFGSLIGAGVAAACCLGVPLVLSTLGAVGLGFIVHDAYLLPLFAAFVGLSLWTLYRSASKRGRLGPFWLAAAGGLIGTAGLWLLVTGKYPRSEAVYVGLGLLVAGNVWDSVNRRRVASCEVASAAEPPQSPDLKRRAVNGAAISIAAAAVFYALYESVEATTPQAEKGDIACWGINSCKGKTACTTAFNACTGQNACKGRGYLNVSAEACKTKGGRPLAGSEADPAHG